MIITNDENALRVFCEEITSIEEYIEIKNILENELRQANKLGKNGIGLAAPQIGLAKNMAIIRLPGISLDLVNSKILKGYDLKEFKDEGCLSFPGRVEDTIRFQEVHIGNNFVEPYNFIATGFLAVACQHEIDHLNSSLFTDHLAPKKNPFLNNKKIGPNDLCFCGSNKKYKKCCRK
jgi:peptide deformylase